MYQYMESGLDILVLSQSFIQNNLPNMQPMANKIEYMFALCASNVPNVRNDIDCTSYRQFVLTS